MYAEATRQKLTTQQAMIKVIQAHDISGQKLFVLDGTEVFVEAPARTAEFGERETYGLVTDRQHFVPQVGITRLMRTYADRRRGKCLDEEIKNWWSNGGRTGLIVNAEYHVLGRIDFGGQLFRLSYIGRLDGYADDKLGPYVLKFD